MKCEKVLDKLVEWEPEQSIRSGWELFNFQVVEVTARVAGLRVEGLQIPR